MLTYDRNYVLECRAVEPSSCLRDPTIEKSKAVGGICHNGDEEIV